MIFIQARNYTKANRTGADVAVVVVHTMEAPERTDTAESVAKWFAGPTAPQASAHYCIDNNSIVGCVREKDVAWHAPGCNHNGIGLEHAGYARQGTADWADPYSTAMLRRSAALVAEICDRWKIPIRRLTATDLKAGKRGLTGHVDVSNAFHRSDHRDPGPGFPWSRYLRMIRQEASKAKNS
jgi:N-acetyl-anhydromuramyl-L-alanine amidase AmpD